MTAELDFVVTLYPEPVLRKEAAPIETFDEQLAATVEAMYRRMYASRGVGLAAPQVGLKQRILVINPSGEAENKDEELTLVNPTIVDRFGAETTMEEGCLSFPQIYAEVTRPEGCKVKAQDIQGNELELTFEGFPSRVIQHEYDHLQGILLVDRMSPADKLRHRAALDELIYQYKASKAPAPKRRLFGR
ncbi:MAG: peptide deformylase [Planctomycetota bacterium]|nr:peptide deformylase [Planctomycetota bacterium]